VANGKHGKNKKKGPISSGLLAPYSFPFLSFCTFLSCSFFVTPFMMVLHNKVWNLGRRLSCYSFSSTFFWKYRWWCYILLCYIFVIYLLFFVWHNNHNTTITFTNASSISFYLFFRYRMYNSLLFVFKWCILQKWKMSLFMFWIYV
jgi:hypothetical protein